MKSRLFKDEELLMQSSYDTHTKKISQELDPNVQNVMSRRRIVCRSHL